MSAGPSILPKGWKRHKSRSKSTPQHDLQQSNDIKWLKSQGSHVFQDALDVKKLICQGSKRENGLSGVRDCFCTSSENICRAKWCARPSHLTSWHQQSCAQQRRKLMSFAVEISKVMSWITLDLDSFTFLYILYQLESWYIWVGDYILYSLGVRFKEAKSEKNEKATTSRFLILSRDDHVKKTMTGWVLTLLRCDIAETLVMSTVCYWKWPFSSLIFPEKNGGSFHSLSYMC